MAPPNAEVEVEGNLSSSPHKVAAAEDPSSLTSPSTPPSSLSLTANSSTTSPSTNNHGGGLSKLRSSFASASNLSNSASAAGGMKKSVSFAALKEEEHQQQQQEVVPKETTEGTTGIPRVESSTGYWTRHDSSPSLYQGTPIYWDEQEGLSPRTQQQQQKEIQLPSEQQQHAQQHTSSMDAAAPTDNASAASMKRVESSTGYWTRHDSTPSLYQGQSVYWDEQEGRSPVGTAQQQQRPLPADHTHNPPPPPPPTLTPSNSTASLKSAVTSSTNYWKRQDSNASMYKQFYWEGESEDAQQAVTEAVQQQVAAANHHPPQAAMTENAPAQSSPENEHQNNHANDDDDDDDDDAESPVVVTLGRPNRSESVASANSGFLFYDEGSTVAGPAPGEPLVMMNEASTKMTNATSSGGMMVRHEEEGGSLLVVPTAIDHSKNLTHAVSCLSLTGEVDEQQPDDTTSPNNTSASEMKRSTSGMSAKSGVTSSTNYWKRTDSTPSMYKPMYWDQEEE